MGVKRCLTYKFRLRDKHAAELNRQAQVVNFVWNYCNEAQRHMLRWDRWLSDFDLIKLTSGTSKELNLNAHTVQRVCRAYVLARKTHRRGSLQWRGRKSLGWVPFNTSAVSFDGASIKFRNKQYDLMHLRDMPARKDRGWELQPRFARSLVHQLPY